FSELLRDVERGAVAEVVVDGDALLATMTDGRQGRTTAPGNYVTANPSFVPDLMKRDVRIDVRTHSEETAFNYAALVMAAAFLSVLAYTLYRVTSGRIPALENRARAADH